MSGWREDPYRGYDEPYSRPGEPVYEQSDEYDQSGEYDEATDEPRRNRITPLRFVIAVAFIGSALATAYALFIERTALQVPILVSGLTVLGISLAIMAFAGALGATEAGQEGRAARAFWSAVLGGLCAIGAAGALGSAVVFALIWVSAR